MTKPTQRGKKKPKKRKVSPPLRRVIKHGDPVWIESFHVDPDFDE
jgi:hypothetical protein